MNNNTHTYKLSYADYYPFGMKMPGKFGGSSYRYAYQGKFAEKDDETGLLSFEARMYDPRIGRWISVDPARQFHSPYMGMGNNPIKYYDPDGRFIPPWLITGAIGGTINAGFNIYSQGGFNSWEDFKNIDGARVAVAFGGGFIAGATGNLTAAVYVNTAADIIDQTIEHNGDIHKIDLKQTIVTAASTSIGGNVTKALFKTPVLKNINYNLSDKLMFSGKLGDVRKVFDFTNSLLLTQEEITGGLFAGGFISMFGSRVGTAEVDASYMNQLNGM